VIVIAVCDSLSQLPTPEREPDVGASVGASGEIRKGCRRPADAQQDFRRQLIQALVVEAAGAIVLRSNCSATSDCAAVFENLPAPGLSLPSLPRMPWMSASALKRAAFS
jgi:hypothetical protein